MLISVLSVAMAGLSTYIKNNSELRFHPCIPRDSEEYRKIYRDRVLSGYFLQHLKIREEIIFHSGVCSPAYASIWMHGIRLHTCMLLNP